MPQRTFYTPITKINDAKRIIKGPVLRPEIRDRQGTIIGADVIEKAAHSFMKRLNLGTSEDGAVPGFMHVDFGDIGLEIVESYVVEEAESYSLDNRLSGAAALKSGIVTQEAPETVQMPAGTWMLAMHVTDDRLWEGVQSGTYKGFSIGGDAWVREGED